ncbi:MAG: DUF1569 domain-containing protein [Bacteroidota bacterium]|nr:DUF1569 domain-containing protein [Bacteroidota bacterium]
MIDIFNKRSEIFSLLEKLNVTAKPVFGKMSPQHMIEHIAIVVSVSNGKHPQKLYSTPEKAEVLKANLIYSNIEMPVGVKAPMLSDEPSPLFFPDMENAISSLRKELIRFDEFFEGNLQATPMHPVLGPLTHKEWIIFHNKHFTHHFKQFKLI